MHQYTQGKQVQCIHFLIFIKQEKVSVINYSFPIYLSLQTQQIISVDILLKEKKVKLTCFSYLIITGNNIDHDKLTKMYFNMFSPRAIILSVVCPLLSSWKSSCFPTVPLVRHIHVQFVFKALVASYWDCTGRWCCSSKIKLVFPDIYQRKHILKQTLKPNQNIK